MLLCSLMNIYEKFKNNNLPTPFWDEKRKTLEYVNVGNRKTIFNFDKAENKIEIYTNLTEALENIADVGFYYPFKAKYQTITKEGPKFVVGKTHSHSFEGVVAALYDSPESFSISKEENEFYSNQELKYLRKLQKYLLFIGLKDIETSEVPSSRYNNSTHEKYKNAYIGTLNNTILNNILKNNLNFIVFNYYDNFQETTYKPKEYQELITDEDYNFKLFIEYTHDEVKTYQEIKNLYPKNNIANNDEVIVRYFNIIEKY